MAGQRNGTDRIVAVVAAHDLLQKTGDQPRIVARHVVVVDFGDSAVGNLHRHESEDDLPLPGDEPRVRTRRPERIVVVLAQHAAPHDQRCDERIETRGGSVQFLDSHIRESTLLDRMLYIYD